MLEIFFEYQRIKFLLIVLDKSPDVEN